MKRHIKFLLFGIATFSGLLSANAQEKALPVENYFVTASAKYPKLKEQAEITVGNTTLKIFLIPGDITDLIAAKNPRYRADAIVASTNVLFDIHGKFPIVQKAIFDALPQEAREDLIKSFAKAKNQRFERYSVTDKTDAVVLLNGAAVEPLFLDPIRGRPSHFCFLATDSPEGGTATNPVYIDFNRPDRISQGVSKCLSNLNGVISVSMPLIGAASAGQPSQPLRTCRMRNALIGDLDGIMDYVLAAAKTSQPIQLRELGIVVWSQDLDGLSDQMETLEKVLPALLTQAATAVHQGRSSSGLQLADCKEPKGNEPPFPPLKVP